MLTPNHKKLLSVFLLSPSITPKLMIVFGSRVNSCYPISTKDEGPEFVYLPQPNALSRLIYYCSTRPHKLSKVSSYLLSYARTQSQPSSLTSSLSPYRHSKSGLLTTLLIFKSLIESTQHEHLQNFLIDFITVISIGLGLCPDSQSNPDLEPGIIGQGWVARDPFIALQSVKLFGTWVRYMSPSSLMDDQLSRTHLFLLAKFSSIAMVAPPISSLSQPLNL